MASAQQPWPTCLLVTSSVTSCASISMPARTVLGSGSKCSVMVSATSAETSRQQACSVQRRNNWGQHCIFLLKVRPRAESQPSSKQKRQRRTQSQHAPMLKWLQRPENSTAAT